MLAKKRATTIAAITVLTSLVTACGGGSSSDDDDDAVSEVPKITALSNRADMISDGDVLIEIVLPDSAADFSDLKVDLDGTDITPKFAIHGGRITGLVDHLKPGANKITAVVGATPAASLVVTNFSKSGPIFSGPHIQPWTCDTTADPSLGVATDTACNAPTSYRYMYRTVANKFAAYDPDNPPAAADIATATTDQGSTVPYIVRIERGTTNRGIHEIAVLFDPAQPWTAFDQQPQWNRKVVMTYGGGTSQQYKQGTPGSVLDHAALSAGYLVAGSSMMVNGQHANFVTTAETTMMLKERIIEQYGEITHTIGQGSSGGALLQHLIADSYPGLLDGLRPTSDWTDSISGAYREFADSAVLTNAFENSTLTYTAADRGAIGGFGEASSGVYARENDRVGDYNMPDDGTQCAGGSSYHPTANITGTRCTFQDFIANYIGKRADGKANLVYDNVGVQYGLVALLEKKITPEMFVDVNVRAGGFDIDGRRQAQRSSITADEAAVLHRTGQVTYGKYMGDVPEVAIRGTNNNDYHYPFRTYVQRARLTATNGNADNHVYWISPPDTQSTLQAVDAWLTAIAADTQPGTKAEKVARNRPQDVVSACWIGEQQVTDMSKCDAQYPYFREPRTAAGEAISGYTMKCQLKPLTAADYPDIRFTSQQWTALQSIFPDGVCDFGKPGVGFQPNVPWLDYSSGPGGQPLPEPPVSTVQ